MIDCNPLNSRIFLMQVHGIDVCLSRKHIKNINLRIDAQGQVKVSVPIRCPFHLVELFLQEKKDWIVKYQDLLRSRLKKLPSQFLSGDVHFFLGKTYTLIIHEYSGQQRVVLEDTHLSCYFKASICHDKKRALIQRWYRNQIKSLIPDLLNKWQSIVGVEVNKWGIKSMKTRWGSCNPMRKCIWLNLHLIHKPLICLEYVLVHELVHLLEPSHNSRFYHLMSQFMPDWQVYKRILDLGYGK